jgi:hypothetical protein
MHVQKRQVGLLKSDKRDALGLANQLYNTLEKGVQSADPLQAVRRLAPPTAAAAQLQGMIHHREELVRERTQRKNKLTSICDELFPECAVVGTNPNSASVLALRTAFPTPAALASARVSALVAARCRLALRAWIEGTIWTRLPGSGLPCGAPLHALQPRPRTSTLVANLQWPMSKPMEQIA